MTNTFHQVECLTRLNQQKIKDNAVPSMSLIWDSTKDTASTHSSFNSASSNPRKFSTPSGAFPNFDVSSVSCPTAGSSSSSTSYSSKFPFDAFNLGSYDDWMCWDNQNGRTLSRSPTQTANTTATTPPDIHPKLETSRSPNFSSVGLGAVTSPCFSEGEHITEDNFMDNTICYEGRENLFQHSNPKSPQKIVRPKSLIQSNKDNYSFPLSYTENSCLNFMDHTPQKIIDSQTSDSAVAINTQASREIVPPDLSFGTHGQQLCYSELLTHFSEQNDGNDSRIRKSSIEYQTAERSETDSNQSEEISLSSISPPPSQSHPGSHSHNSVDARYLSRKRKSHYNFDEQNRDPSLESTPNSLTLNENSIGPEEVPASGIVHNIGRTKTPKKTAHNMIEKRYRTNLNDKIAALRDAVPSLRVAIRNDLGFVQDGNGNSKISEITEHRDNNYNGRSKTGVVDIESEDLQGLAVAHKLNKATILTKAAEYIAHLEKRNRALRSENTALKGRISAFEMMNLSGNFSNNNGSESGSPAEIDACH